MSIVLSAIFALVCFGVAITGFIGSGDLTDPVQKADGMGFAWFWTFLGAIAVVSGGLSAWILQTQKEPG